MKRRTLKWQLLLVLSVVVSLAGLHDSTKWPGKALLARADEVIE
jgi:hypothetical protein